MSQRQWKYIDVFGNIHHIGFYHGGDSGHFVLYINNEISAIQFGVHDSKVISFYIGPELLQLKITKIDAEKFDYDLEYDVDVTPKSNFETIRDRFVKIALIAISIGVFLFLAYFFLIRME